MQLRCGYKKATAAKEVSFPETTTKELTKVKHEKPSTSAIKSIPVIFVVVPRGCSLVVTNEVCIAGNFPRAGEPKT